MGAKIEECSGRMEFNRLTDEIRDSRLEMPCIIHYLHILRVINMRVKSKRGIFI